MKLTAADLLELGVIDGVIRSRRGVRPSGPPGALPGAGRRPGPELGELDKVRPAALAAARYQKFRQKFRKMGEQALRKERP